MNPFARLRPVKQEPVEQADALDADFNGRGDPMDEFPPPPPPVRRESRTTVDPPPPIQIGGGPLTVKNVTLTPLGRPSAAVDATLPHEAGVFSLDSYDEPSQVALAASRAGVERPVTGDSNSPAAFIDYIVARTEAGGPLVASRTTGEPTGANAGYYSSFVRVMMSAPPHRSMPASNSDFAKLRLHATPVEREWFEEMCSTPGAGDVPCCAGSNCKALGICNAQGAPICNTVSGRCRERADRA